jgi:MFS family permease
VETGPHPPAATGGVGGRRPPALRTVLTASAVATFALMPAFLVGSLSVALQSELSLSAATLGNTVSAFFVSATVAAVPVGRLVDRLGARRSVIGTALLSGAVLLGIPSLVQRPWHLAVFLLAGGVAHASAQPAANLALLHAVQPRRRGLAVGVKQSAAPLTTLLAGASVPVFGLTVGWRWAFAAFGLAALVPVAIAPRVRHAPAGPGPQSRSADANRRSLVLIAIAAGCGTVLGTSIGTFLVVSAVALGIAPGPAGLLLTVASISSIVVRLALGWLVDRRGFNPLIVGGAVIWAGALGLAGIAVTANATVFVAMAIIGMAFGWGWPTLLHYSIVRFHGATAGAATGVVLTGVSMGGIIGPSMFGNIASALSYRAAWLALAAVAVVTGVLLWLAGREVGRAHSGRPAAP